MTAKVIPPEPTCVSMRMLERKNGEADMEPVRFRAAAECSAPVLTKGPPRVKYSIAKNSLKAMGFRRIFLLRSKSYGR
jgi:hypothetical protein